jgi:predicted site-specific integrase-resolvase
MILFSTNPAAQQLGIAGATLSRYISAKKIPAPKIVEAGGLRVHAENGRTLRYKNLQKQN